MFYRLPGFTVVTARLPFCAQAIALCGVKKEEKGDIVDTKHGRVVSQSESDKHVDKEIAAAMGTMAMAFVIIVLPQPFIAFAAFFILPKLLR